MKRLFYLLAILAAIVTSVTVLAFAAGSSEGYSPEGGTTFSAGDRLLMKNVLPDIPSTFEVTVKYPKTTNKTNVLLGTYTDVPAKRPSTFMYYVDKGGYPMLYIRDSADTATKYLFNKVKIYTGNWIDLAIVIDGSYIHCYVDGTLKQTLDYTAPTLTPSKAPVVGGDYRERTETSGGVPTGRAGSNYAYCLGSIKSMALYSDTRTAAEVAADRTAKDLSDSALIACYDLSTGNGANMVPDRSSSNNHLIRENLNGGLTFVQENKYVSSSALASVPETVEAVFRMPDDFTGRGGIIYSNYANTTVRTNMALHVQYGNKLCLWYENKTNLDDRVYYDVVADMTIPSGEWVHVAAVRDLEKEEWRFYLNGKLADTVYFSEFTEKQITAMKAVKADSPFKLGNDYRKDQSIFFKGELLSVTAYSEVRSAEEIFRDVTVGATKDDSLLAYYDLKFAADSPVIPDRSGNGKNITNTAYVAPDDPSGEGMTFNMSNSYAEKYPSNSFPHTIEAMIELPVGDCGQRTIISSYDPSAKASSYQLTTVNGVPNLVLYTPVGKALEYRFENLTAAELCTGKFEHFTFVMDTDAREFRVYLNGVLEDTKKFNAPKSLSLTVEEINALDFDFALGAPLLIGRNYAATEESAFPFTGHIKSLVTYSDARTAGEILGDMYFPESDGNLTGYYDVEFVGARKPVVDLSYRNNDFMASNGDSLLYSQETAGMVFDNQYFYETYNKFDVTPLTFEAVVKLPSTGNGGSDKVIIGNYFNPTTSNTLNFEITGTVCHPEIYVIDRNGNEYSFLFDKVTASTDYWEHIAVTFDKASGYAYCYQNGLLVQKLPYAGELDSIDWNDCRYPHILGGDWQSADFGKFNRRMMYTALYTSVRSAEEIYRDASYGIDTTDRSLLVYYDCLAATADGSKTPATISDGLSGKYDAHYFYPFFDKETKNPSSYDYSFAVVGDTQLINEKYPEKYAALYDWLIANADAKKLEFVLGLGDICQTDSDAEWERAAVSLSKLRDAGIPQSIVCGSYHDSIPQYNKYLPYQDYVNAYAGKIEYGFYDNGNGQPSLANAYHIFTVGETKYMVLTLDYGPGTALVNWANSVIEAHPDCNVIVTTHAYLFTDGTRFSTYDYPSPDTTGSKDAHNGDELWDALIRKHENIVMTISGHAALDRIVKTVSYGDHGNRIVEMLINPQETDTNYEGTGLVAMLYFSDGGKKVDLEYFSTDKLQYFYECNQFSFELSSVGDEEAHINQASVSLGNGINVNYYARLTGKYTNAVMRFTVNGKVTTVSPKATDSSGNYVFVYRGIEPQLVGDEITAELMLGNEVIDTADVFSVEAYAKKLLKSDKFELTYSAKKCESLHEMLAALLDYCAKAQETLNYKTDALVNEGILTEIDGFDPTAIESSESFGEISGTSGAKFLTASAKIDKKAYLELTFSIGSAAISDVTVAIGDKIYSEKDFTEGEGGKYILITDPISALEFDKALTAALKVSEEEAHSVTYSIGSYIKTAYNDESKGDLIKALYLYGRYSEIYAFGTKE